MRVADNIFTLRRMQARQRAVHKGRCPNPTQFKVLIESDILDLETIQLVSLLAR